MGVTVTWIIGRITGQTAQVDLTPQGINDPQHTFQSQGGLARFQVDNEAHTYPRCQRQLGLCQPELLASSPQSTS
jgi:hypothetical protein